MARTGQIRGRRGIIGGYWGGYSLLSSSPTPRALPGKVENLTPPAAGQKRTGWSTTSAGRAAGSGAAGTVAPGSVPAPAARHRNGEQTTTAHDMHRDAPGAADRTASADRRPEQQRTTRRRPGLFLLPHLPACRLPGLPDQQPGTRWALCRPGEKLESTRGALGAVPGYCARHLHREGSAPPAPHPMTTPAARRRTR